jgi:predicted porin
MNKKLIAAAVSASVMAPVVASAQDEGPSMTVYARVNQAITVRDVDVAGGSTDVDVSNIASRFGLKGSADVGNGMTAHGRLEFSVGADREQPGVGDIRIGTVGLSGAFGSITVGNQYSSYSTLVGTHFDPLYTLGYFLYSQIGAPYRASNTIKYANSFGPVSLGVDLRLNDSEETQAVAEGPPGGIGANGNGFGISASFAASDNITIAAGYDAEEATDTQIAAGADDQSLFGIAMQASFGGFWGSIGWQGVDDGLRGPGATSEMVQLFVGTDLGEKTSALIGYGQSELDNGTGAPTVEPETFNLGIYHSLGGGMKLYYEGVIYDADNEAGAARIAGSTFDNDLDYHYFGMRIDF